MGFASFLVRRILLGIVVLWFVTVGTFLLFFVAPQDPARLLAGKNTTAAQIANINRRLGLDQPLIVQYWHYLDRLLHGNLGTSYFTGTSVNTILKEDLPPTLSLLVGGVVLWLIVGISVGILSATRARTLLDRISTTGVLIGITFPTFVVGLLLLFFVYKPLNQAGFHWIQTGYEGPTESVSGWIGHMILPWITIAAVSAATYTRLTRGSLLDVLGEDYIRTARAKGLRESRVTFRHALRAALAPVITQLGIDTGTLFGGAVITEVVFGLPGLGYTAVQAITNQDLPVIIGVVIVTSAAVVVANLLVDIGYALLDPRVRLH
jgi:peptide/nickel transport system permease protein